MPRSLPEGTADKFWLIIVVALCQKCEQSDDLMMMDDSSTHGEAADKHLLWYEHLQES